MPRETHLPHQTQAKQTVAEATEKLYEKKEPDNKWQSCHCKSHIIVPVCLSPHCPLHQHFCNLQPSTEDSEQVVTA